VVERMERWDCQLNKKRCCEKVTSEAAMARDKKKRDRYYVRRVCVQPIADYRTQYIAPLRTMRSATDTYHGK
jgi:hypothetical protein